MNTLKMAVGMSASALLCAGLFAPQQGLAQEKDGQGQAIVTILPKHDGQSPSTVAPQDVKLKVNGKEATVGKFVALKGDSPVEMVVLIDGSARTSLARQLDDLAHFIQALPPNAKSAVAYMQNGTAAFAGPLTDDHAQVVKELHIPGGMVGSNASPYFCLSDLAKRWPSQDRAARREVIMITDGVDEYNRRYDPEDPYVQSAMNDATRAGLVVYSIYWRDQGRASATGYENNAGQNLLQEVTQATGGKSFWEGAGNPVSFEPYLAELNKRLQNQYELSFTIPFNGKPQVETMKLNFKAPGMDVSSPQQVFVGGAAVQE